uniref:Uncharacterized protein n=1 Tax=viral metagenome TaxID=1070528 RepID=A0A6C0HCU5_9ZZZZ
MSLASWMQPYEEYIDLSYLAMNPHPNVIPYLQQYPDIIDWEYLSTNPTAIELLKENTNCINWKQICLNPHPEAIEFVKEHYKTYLKRWTEKRRRIPYDLVLSWENLSQNPSAVKFLKKNPVYTYWHCQEPPYEPNQDDYGYESEYLKNLYPDNEINWEFLSANPNGVKLLKKNREKIDWDCLSCNISKKAIKLLKKNPDKINWYWLSQNPSAIELILQHRDMVDWRQLCKNPHPAAVKLLEENYIEIDWSYMSANPSAIYLLEQYAYKIDWRWLCKNPNGGQLLANNIETQYEKLDWQWLSENPCIFME